MLPAAQQPPTPRSADVYRDIAPIFQEKCEACHRPIRWRDVAQTSPRRGRGRVRSRPASAIARCRRGKSIGPSGIQKFQERPILTDDQVETIVRWGGRRCAAGDAKDCPPPNTGLTVRAELRGDVRPERADLIIKSYDFTMPAVSQDVWDKRITPSASPSRAGFERSSSGPRR